MNKRRKFLAALAAGALAAPLVTFAQSFPAKPVRLIVRAPPGGTDDLIARLIAPAIGKTVGQQVIVDYRTGAGGLVAWEYVAKQPPDGYTLLLAASGLAAIKSLRPDTPVDPFRDFGWVTQVTSFMLALIVHPSLPTRTVKELIAFARSRPGQLSYGTSGVGATPHQSPLIPASLISAAHFFISARMTAANSAGVLPTAMAPSLMRFCANAGERTTLTISLCRRSMIGFGVAAGAKIPFQPRAS